MNEPFASSTIHLAVRSDDIVFDVPSEVEGVDEIVYVLTRTPHEPTTGVNLGGAWRDLVDGDTMLDALDQIGNDTPLSPPITSID
jgi:hypothetical protein